MFGEMTPPQLHYNQGKSEFNETLFENLSPNQLTALQNENFALWVKASGLEVDHRPFDFDSHRYLLPLYMDNSKEIVLMKAAQMGATIWMLLRLLWFCGCAYAHRPIKACLYFPTQEGVGKLSKDRLKPLIASNQHLSNITIETDTIGYKQIGKSSLYLQHMGGEATKDSTPFDMICFDEVRLLNPADIDQARERISHSEYKYVMQVSTAGLPNCLAGSTKVIVKSKKDQKVHEMTIRLLTHRYRDYWILSYSKDHTLCWREINAAKRTGRRNVVEVEFTGGFKVMCTPDHRFAQFNEGNITWTEIAKVKKFRRQTGVLSVIPFIERDLELEEKLPHLGQLAVGEAKPAGRKDVFDIEVFGYPAFVLAGSGCLVHNSDIHKAFLGGTQNYWYVKCLCPNSDGFIPSDHWPDCVAVTEKEIYLRCPKCGAKIQDPQNGKFIAHKPSAPYPSYHISQLISKYISVSEIWDAWTRTQNLKEFWNAKLGVPYVDAENQPVKDDDLMACENPDLLWGPSKTKFGGRIQRAMGIDQMSGVNYVFIAERHENKKRVVHYEIVDPRNPEYSGGDEKWSPFKRCHQMMTEYDIDMCIVDAMPNINEAMEFAMAFPKRCFVAHYMEGQREIVQWGDRPKHKITVRKGGPKIKFKYTCLLSRYLSIDAALGEVANRNYEWPHPRKLIQVCRSIDTGKYEPLHIFETHFYRHLKSIVRQKTWIDELAGRFKMEWVNLGLDPHSVHALNLCNIALERLIKTPLWTI